MELKVLTDRFSLIENQDATPSLKVLNPILITNDLYIPMNIYSDEKIASSEKVSKFISIRPFYCNYVSFKQTFPLDINKSISSLVYQPGSPSVFQFITSQLHYKVEWYVETILFLIRQIREFVF